MPLVPPVTRATLPENFCDILLSRSNLGITNLTTPRSSTQAAIHSEARARNESGFRAGEIRDHASHLVVLSIATEGSHLSHLFGKVSSCGIHVGVNWARLDVVDRDAASPQIADEPMGKAGDRPLSQGIDRETGNRGEITAGYLPSALFSELNPLIRKTLPKLANEPNSTNESQSFFISQKCSGSLIIPAEENSVIRD